MSKKRIKAIFYRLREMIAGSAILSVAGSVLCISGLMPVGSAARDITLALIPLIYLVWNVFMLRSCYVMVRRKKSYYIINLCATCIFSMMSAACYVFLPKKVYSLLFLVTYLAGFSNLGITGRMAIIMSSAAMLASIFLALIKMEWVQEKVEKRKREMKTMPPRMEIIPEVTPGKSIQEEEK